MFQAAGPSGSASLILVQHWRRRIGGAIRLVVLLALVEAVQRAAGRADHASDRRAFARALPATGDPASGGADGGAGHGADQCVRHGLLRLAAVTDLLGRVPVARVNRLLSGDGRGRRRARLRTDRRGRVVGARPLPRGVGVVRELSPGLPQVSPRLAELGPAAASRPVLASAWAEVPGRAARVEGPWLPSPPGSCRLPTVEPRLARLRSRCSPRGPSR